MDIAKNHENIRLLINNGDLDKAIPIFLETFKDSPFAKDATILCDRYHSLQRKIGNTTISEGEAIIQRSRIVEAIIDILDSDPFNPTAHPPKYLTATRNPPLAAKWVLGRENDLAAIEQKFADGDQSLLLHALGGVGKSTLAGYYMERCGPRYRHIAWVRCTGNFVADCLRDIFDYDTLGITGEAGQRFKDCDQPGQFDLLLYHLARLPQPNLLIIDNLNTLADAEDIAARQQQFPDGWKVLLTARERHDSFPFHPVGVLPLPEAIALYERHCPGQSLITNHQSLITLLEHVGRHTLVVEFLAKTAKLQGWPPAKLLDRLKDQGLTHLHTKARVSTAHSQNQSHTISNYIAALFDLNLSKLDDDERWLLANLAVLPPFVHPLSLLEEMLFFGEGIEDYKERFPQDDLYRLLHGLAGKGFLEELTARRPTHTQLEDPAPEETGFYMHPVMQEVVRDKDRPDYDHCAEMVHYFIIRHSDGDGSKNPALAFPWLPYGEMLANRLPDHEGIGTLANNFSQIYLAQGQLTKALEWQLKAIAIYEKVLGENHPDLISSYNNLSAIYHHQGQFLEALERQLKTIAITKKALGENHLSLATSYNNLSQIYLAQGQLPAALEWQLKDIAIIEKALGENHPSLATSYNNLSLIYQAQGQIPEALERQLKAIAIREKVLRENHPDHAQSYNNLSQIYQNQGQLSAALEWQLKAIAIREKTLGENHPDLAGSYNNLSLIYQDQGQLPEALKWQLKAIAITKKALGGNHPLLATSYNNLSEIYKAKSQLPEALEWQLKAITIFEKALGESHPNLAGSLWGLATIYNSMQDPKQALPYIQQAVAIFQLCFPDGHHKLDGALWWLEHIEKAAAQD